MTEKLEMENMFEFLVNLMHQIYSQRTKSSSAFTMYGRTKFFTVSIVSVGIKDPCKTCRSGNCTRMIVFLYRLSLFICPFDSSRARSSEVSNGCSVDPTASALRSRNKRRKSLVFKSKNESGRSLSDLACAAFSENTTAFRSPNCVEYLESD